MRRFRLAPQAREDIREIRGFIAADSVRTAARVREELIELIDGPIAALALDRIRIGKAWLGSLGPVDHPP